MDLNQGLSFASASMGPGSDRRGRARRGLRPGVTGLEGRHLLTYTLTDLSVFTGANGSTPYSGVIIDGQGDLYGTTTQGGADGLGTVYEEVKGSNGTYSLDTLASFDGTDGSGPIGDLAFDGQGDLYGTTSGEGPNGTGTVFEVVKGSNAITTVASFTKATGYQPFGGVVFDAQGNLYGTTTLLGTLPGDSDPAGEGTIYEIAKGSNVIKPLFTFDGPDGAVPEGSLIFDGQGDLYGTTEAGGINNTNNDDGTVFEYTPGTDTLKTLVSFNGTDGQGPQLGSLAMDAQGNLYGETDDGSTDDAGTVFEYVKSTSMLKTITSFNESDGQNPDGGVILDSHGNLFGTTYYGGTSPPGQSSDNGEVFEIAAGTTTLTQLAAFNRNDGEDPSSGVVMDSQGDLFGTTRGLQSSSGAVGAVFELSPRRATINSTVNVSWGTSATASLQTAPDGLRLLPQGRATDLPWEGVDKLSVTLSQPEALSASDVSVRGIAVQDYGPVTVAGSGSSYTITLARPIDSADRVTVTIANAGINAFTRRLDVLPGDVNDDGVVNSQDAVLVRNMVLGIGGTSPTTFGDINGDGAVNLADYNLVREFIGTRLPAQGED